MTVSAEGLGTICSKSGCNVLEFLEIHRRLQADKIRGSRRRCQDELVEAWVGSATNACEQLSLLVVVVVGQYRASLAVVLSPPLVTSLYSIKNGLRSARRPLHLRRCMYHRQHSHPPPLRLQTHAPAASEKASSSAQNIATDNNDFHLLHLISTHGQVRSASRSQVRALSSSAVASKGTHFSDLQMHGNSIG